MSNGSMLGSSGPAQMSCNDPVAVRVRIQPEPFGGLDDTNKLCITSRAPLVRPSIPRAPPARLVRHGSRERAWKAALTIQILTIRCASPGKTKKNNYEFDHQTHLGRKLGVNCPRFTD